MPSNPLYENYDYEQLHELALAWCRKSNLPDNVANSIVFTPITDEHGNSVGEFYLKLDRADWIVPSKLFFSETEEKTVLAWIKASIAVSSSKSDDLVFSHYDELSKLLLLVKALFMLTGDLPVDQSDPCFPLIVEESHKSGEKIRPGAGPEDRIEFRIWTTLRSILGASPC